MPSVSKRIRVAVLVSALAAIAAFPVTPKSSPAAAPTWAEVDRLVKDQKFQKASGLVDRLLESAKRRRDEADWTKALVRGTQLRIGLGSYETAVRFLKEQPWPPGLLSRTTLDLLYGQALVQYERAFSWEIGQREKVASGNELDLKAWTREQIFDEAQRAYRRAWDRRAELGALPVGALSEYIEPNDYPKDVRGTLRDAVSYLTVGLLADSSLWAPELSGNLYTLDLPALLAADGHDADARLSDPKAHPLEKVAAVLGDLETWHASQGHRAAALEARIERARRLTDAFSSEDWRITIRRDFEKRLERDRSIPWWSMGMAELAALIELEPTADNLVRAREAVLAGRTAYPSSVGGRRCAEIADRIGAPEYLLSSMLADAPDRRSIQVEHKNLARLSFRAYHLDLQERIAEASDEWLLPPRSTVERLLRTGPPDVEWRVELPATPDFKRHRTFVTPPIAARGLWVVVASVRPDFGEKNNLVASTAIILGNLVVVTQTDPSWIEARVVAADTGRPVQGAEVRLVSRGWDAQGGHPLLETLVSDAEGLVRFDYDPSLAHRSLFLMALKDGDVALDSNVFSLSLPATRTESAAALVYTDRPIYRPLQKILWKVVAYEGVPNAGKFRVSPGATVTVALQDQSNQVVETRTVTTNGYGSAAGEFPIPAGHALGMWMIRTSPSGWAGVRVEEYKRPTFEVQWNDPAAPMRLSRDATVTGSARYYFGLPVSNGSVRWSVTRQPRFPRWWFWEHHFGLEDAAVVVARGASPLKPDGTFEASFRADAAPGRADAPDLTYQFEISADVTDEGGETRTGNRTFRLGPTAVEATIRTDWNFLPESVSGTMTVVRTDLDGAPRSGVGHWELVSLVEPERTLLPADQPVPPGEWNGADPMTPGDRLRPRWTQSDSLEIQLHGWKDGRKEAEATLEHDAKGEGIVHLPTLRPGAWRLRYETRDAFGGIARASRDFLVAGGKMPVRLAGVLLAERDSVAVGGTARLLAFSGLPDQTFFLETLRDGRVVSRRTLLGSDAALVEIPIREEDRGGFGFRLSLVADHQLVSSAARVMVPWDDERLHVSFSTFRDRIRPGTRETWRVRVEGPPGAASEERVAELLAEMYDRSLDAFTLGAAPPDPVAFYPDRTWGGSLQTSLGESGGLRIFNDAFGAVAAAPPLRGDRLKFLEGYGIGGPGVRGGIRMMAKAEAAPQRAPASAPVDQTASAAYIGTNEGEIATGRELPPEPVLRSDFSETAFWKPQLLTDADGSAAIEFQVPDSVTSWNVWVHAITKDFKAGSVHRETRSVNDLMVRPYVPRFLREGDRGELKVVVNNASESVMSGTVALDILDTETNRSVLADFGLTADAVSRAFSAAAGGSADVSFPIAAPKRVGAYAIKATAVAGDFSDGELRPVPVLPGRMQLSQSRFAALRGGDTRTLSFPDMARTDDPSRVDEQLVATVDAQLFYSVLNALPYLVNYPYECVEQTLNRFVSTGIVSSLFRQYPAVERMAQELAKRDTPLEAWAAPDPTRRMALEETPWLEAARGGKDEGAGLVKVLDPGAGRAEREASLAKLRQAQTASGAFPWWPGGPPSPYMTLYVMYGFAKAAEFGVDVPRDVVARGWAYLSREFREEYEKRMAAERCSPEWLTFLAYVASCYPDPSWMGDALTRAERDAILAFSFRHWREQSPYLKGMLALTLKRSGRGDDARRVWASVMDSSKTDADLGTYWATEERAWLWYEDTIETQAFALRALVEIAPSDPRRHGLVQWLFLNKKLNQWKSTRATAEVLYALVAYLKKEGALAEREAVTVSLAGQKTVFDFAPDRYTGSRDQVVVPGERIDPRRDADVAVSKTGTGLAFASATWSFSTDRLPEGDRGDLFAVSRRYYRREPTAAGFELRPLAEGAALSPGDEVEVQLSIRARHAAEYVHLRDPRAAGLEPGVATSGYRWDLGLIRYEEIRDSGTNFFFETLPAGEYTLKYRVRANMAGTFRVGPATLQSMYAPEFSAYSAGETITIR